MKHAVPHQLDQATAKVAAQKAFEAYAARFPKYSPVARWVTEQRCEVQFSVKGMTLKGLLELVPGAIELDLDVPFVFRVFKGQAIAVIEEEVKKWIGKAQAGELS